MKEDLESLGFIYIFGVLQFLSTAVFETVGFEYCGFSVLRCLSTADPEYDLFLI